MVYYAFVNCGNFKRKMPVGEDNRITSKPPTSSNFFPILSRYFDMHRYSVNLQHHYPGLTYYYKFSTID